MKINLKKVGVVFLGLALCASFVAVTAEKASANEGNGVRIGTMLGIGMPNAGVRDEIREAGMKPQMSIGVNGRVLVRGAKVTGIPDSAGNIIFAQVAWGSFVFDWKVDASKAKFLRYPGNASDISGVAVGDIISFSGDLDASASSAAVKADYVKDWSADGPALSRRGTLQGELKAIGGVSAPTTMKVEVKGRGNANDDAAVGDFSVNVAANTAVLDRNWGAIGLESFKVGDTVRFYGLINSDNTVNATVVRDISR